MGISIPFLMGDRFCEVYYAIHMPIHVTLEFYVVVTPILSVEIFGFLLFTLQYFESMLRPCVCISVAIIPNALNTQMLYLVP